MAFDRGFNVSSTDGCCGVQQIADFSVEAVGEWDYREHGFTGRTLASVYKKMYKAFDSDLEKGYIYQIWFVKQKNFNDEFNENFEAEELRQLVMNRPNVRTLGSTTNPNSGNIIEGYQWIA